MDNRLKTINEFAVTLLMQSDLADIVWTIADRIGTILGFEDCVLYLREGDNLNQAAAYGHKKFGERDIRERIVIPIGQGIVGTVAATGIGEVIPDTKEDPRYIWDQFSGRSELTVPILYEGEVLGIIDSEAREPGAFSNDDLEFMQALANMAAPRIASELAKQRLSVADRKLRRSEDTLHCTVEAVSDGIITFGRAGRISSVNAAAESIFGYGRDELVGQDCRMLLPRNEADRHYRRLMRLVRHEARPGGDVVGIEANGLHRDGTVFPMEINIRPATLDSGSRIVVATVRNIADRKAAQQALQYRIEFENLISEISTRFINLRAEDVDEGIENALREIGEFVKADAAYVFRFFDNQTRYSQTHLWHTESSRTRKEELQDMRIEKLPWWMQQLKSGQTVAIDRVDELPEAAQSERMLLQSVNIQSIIEVPMMRQGVVTGYLGLSCTTERSWSEDERALLELVGQIVSNALQHKETVKELVRSRQAAQAASRAKSQFLANMSHELRTPLNAIIGYSELLRMSTGTVTRQALESDLDSINQAGNHLLSLITDILDLAKIEAGKTSFHNEAFSLSELVSTVAATATPLIKVNDNHFTVICDADIGDMHGDATRVRQIILNLLSNAAKFTHNGQVTLDVERQDCNGIASVVFSVTDSGIGIPEDKLEHIFAEFEQVDTSDTREYGGTGLGLAISKRICRLMGGDITVTSRPGIGSKFTTILPLGAAESESGFRAA